MKLNIGCGDVYKEGYINIDGSETIGADKVIDLNNEKLTDHFENDTVDSIITSDIIEHFYRWEAVNLMQACFDILKQGGDIFIRVPDTEKILNHANFTLEQKLLFLYGGQDVPQGNPKMDKTRKAHPEYFCHKYGWTLKTLSKQLEDIGFKVTKRQSEVGDGFNMVVLAVK